MSTEEMSTEEKIIELLNTLSDRQRLEIFAKYCSGCGCDDPDCYCWNDE